MNEVPGGAMDILIGIFVKKEGGLLNAFGYMDHYKSCPHQKHVQPGQGRLVVGSFGAK